MKLKTLLSLATFFIFQLSNVYSADVEIEMLNKLDKKELIILLEEEDANNIKLEDVDLEVLNNSLIKIAFKPSSINEGEIIEKIYKSGSKIKSINSKEPDLEELFLELTNNDVN